MQKVNLSKRNALFQLQISVLHIISSGITLGPKQCWLSGPLTLDPFWRSQCLTGWPCTVQYLWVITIFLDIARYYVCIHTLISLHKVKIQILEAVKMKVKVEIKIFQCSEARWQMLVSREMLAWSNSPQVRGQPKRKVLEVQKEFLDRIYIQ